MFRKLLLTLATMALVIAVPTGVASAAPPEHGDVPDYLSLFLDEDEGKSVWVNITALDFCVWASDGFNGPPPVINDAVPATLKVVGPQGSNAVASIKTDGLYLEIWELDNPEGPFLGACEDILDQLLAGTGPWATGTTSMNTRTNNLFNDLDGPRVISDGSSGTAIVTTTDTGDSYRYQFTTHGNSRCHEGSCFVTNSSIRRT